MSFINVKHISKTFKVAKRRSGIKATLKSFFKRNYIYVEAIKDISFQIEKGEIVGYIGPNGAGKSTTIKILSGILVPDSGECRINGLTPWKDREKYTKDIGVVFGQRSQLWWDIPAEDTFDLLKEIYKIDDKEYIELLELFLKTYDKRLLEIYNYLKEEERIELCPKRFESNKNALGLNIHLTSIDESYVLSRWNNKISSASILPHELGHAFLMKGTNSTKGLVNKNSSIFFEAYSIFLEFIFLIF